MSKALFIPLNSNHALIFERILKYIEIDYKILCHDKISEIEHNHTESTLKKFGIPYIHFPKQITRSPSDTIFLKITNFFKMKHTIKELLNHLSPKVVIFAIDNDPIAKIFISLSKIMGIKSVLIQEGLIRPYEYTMRETHFSDYFYHLLRFLGIHLKYTTYGTSGCDNILANGNRASEIFQKRGVLETKIEIVGQPKYDDYIRKLESYTPHTDGKKTVLFAAGSNIVKDHENIEFLKILIQAIRKLDAYLIIKMHPRTPETPDNIYNIINEKDNSFFEVIKQSDDTFEILKDIYALITVSSTMIIEALMMSKEGIVVDYLAGEQKLDYNKYDAVYSIESRDQIYDVIKDALTSKKPYENKKHLLEDELYKLDGRSAKRTAKAIQALL